MAKYGYCKECGCLMEKVGCPNCEELVVINYIDSLWGDESYNLKEEND
jgi:RNA polymerase subunit RPABC4/transcription elongation factor Spt4